MLGHSTVRAPREGNPVPARGSTDEALGGHSGSAAAERREWETSSRRKAGGNLLSLKGGGKPPLAERRGEKRAPTTAVAKRQQDETSPREHRAFVAGNGGGCNGPDDGARPWGLGSEPPHRNPNKGNHADHLRGRLRRSGDGKPSAHCSKERVLERATARENSARTGARKGVRRERVRGQGAR